MKKTTKAAQKEVKNMKVQSQVAHILFDLNRKYGNVSDFLEYYKEFDDKVFTRISNSFSKFLGKVNKEWIKLEYTCDCDICCQNQTENVSKPYEVDPNTINRTYDCDCMFRCKFLAKNFPEEFNNNFCDRCKNILKDKQ